MHKRKPSDTPERRLERQHRHRRGKRFENWISGINKIAAHGDDEKNSFLERALETGIQPKPYLNLIKSRATLDKYLTLPRLMCRTSAWLGDRQMIARV